MNELINVGELKTQMTSLEIAELTGKEHRNILRDIDSMLEQGVDVLNFEQTVYADSQNRKQRMYSLTKKGCLILASGYDVRLREQIINRWEELEMKEKSQFKVPTSFREALLLAAEQQEIIEKQQYQIEVMQPKVLFTDAVIGSRSSCLIGELAKILTQNGYEIGQNRLFEWLRKNYYIGTKGETYNIPNQKYIEQGLFELKKGVRSGNDGVLHTTITPKITGKGQLYFINKFLGNK